MIMRVVNRLTGPVLLAGIMAMAAPAAAQLDPAPLALGFASHNTGDDIFRRPPLHVDGRYVVIRLDRKSVV